MGFGYVEGVTHDYKPNGTTTLFAALTVLNGVVLASCKPRHRHQEFLKFLREIDQAVPETRPQISLLPCAATPSIFGSYPAFQGPLTARLLCE